MIKGQKLYDPIGKVWSTGYWIPLYSGKHIFQYLPVWPCIKKGETE